MSDIEITVDARHMICPMPVIKTQEAITHLQHGDVLQVLATDPGVAMDIPAWLRVHGHELVSHSENEQQEIVFIIKVVRD